MPTIPENIRGIFPCVSIIWHHMWRKGGGRIVYELFTCEVCYIFLVHTTVKCFKIALLIK